MTRPGPVTPASGDDLLRVFEHAYWAAGQVAVDRQDLSAAVRRSWQAGIAAVRPLIEAEVVAKWTEVVKKACHETALAVAAEANRNAAIAVDAARADERALIAAWLRNRQHGLEWPGGAIADALDADDFSCEPNCGCPHGRNARREA